MDFRDAFDWLRLIPANDNHDSRDYDGFDPSVLPADMFYADDTPLDVCAFFNLMG
jgi:hypothetical protein